MTCKVCKNVIERADVPHVIRKCDGCGRELHIQELGDHGRGLQIRKGDKFSIPLDYIKPSFNPLNTNVRMSAYGLEHHAKTIHLGQLPTTSSKVIDALKQMEDASD